MLREEKQEIPVRRKREKGKTGKKGESEKEHISR